VITSAPLRQFSIWSLPPQEGSGFVAARTGSLVVFGSYSSSMFPSVCVEAVERLGEERSHAEVSDIREMIGWGPAGEECTEDTL